MDKKMVSNESNNFNYDTLILEQAILLQQISEIRALNMGIIPKMVDIKEIHLIEPEWNKVSQKQVISRIFRK